jgi:glucosamine-6-phosphate deaminase
MRIVIEPDYQSTSRIAADFIAAQVIAYPASVLGFATGTTPIGLYEQLGERCKSGGLDFSKVRTVNLDEYCGLSGTHPQSYRYFMNKHFFSKTNIPKANTFLPDGMAEDFIQEGERYEKLIRDLGGVDLQLLGIGHNGHVGFNEPSDVFDRTTHRVRLTETTIEANARLFNNKDEVPGYAMTMGIQTIMRARRILLVVTGRDKASILVKALTGPITPQVPASVLQLHPDLTVIGDAQAMSEMPQGVF